MKAYNCLLTNDVETTSIWHNTLRDETGKKVLTEGMPVLLDIYEKYSIKSTFFVTGYIAKLYPEIVKLIIRGGHEVGSHGLSHEVYHGFDMLGYQQQVNHLEESKKILEDISGEEVISFRSPALRVNKHTPAALVKTGYKIDSSVASTRFDAFLSFGSKDKLKWIFAPRKPYKTRLDSLHRRGTDGIIEIPLSSTVMPYLGTTMRIFPKITRLQHSILHLEMKSNPRKAIVFDIHPNEIIDETDERRMIRKRTTNYISYLFKDLLRSKMKSKNLGLEAALLYEKEIGFYNSRKYSFSTIRDYCKKVDLL